MMEFGITPEQFRERHFEKHPYLFRGALTARPIGWAELDELLYRIEPTDSGIQVFNRGLVPAAEYVQENVEFGQRRRRLNKIRFYSYMRSGATLVVNRLETHSSAAHRICVEVGRFAAQPATGNGYLSFSGDGTFGKHWDTHDVFAVQLIGRKRWQIYAPTLPLPLSHQTSSQQAGERSDLACPAQPAMDCVLETGDVLYVPRGWWHQVMPLEEGSLHFSVGTYAPTTQDYLSWLCTRVLPQALEGRMALDTVTDGQMAAAMQLLSDSASDPGYRAEFELSHAAKETPTSGFNSELFLNRRVPILDDSMRLRINARATPDAQGRMGLGGVTLQLDPVAAGVIRLMAASKVSSFGEIARRLPEVPRETVHRTLLELVGREMIHVD